MKHTLLLLLAVALCSFGIPAEKVILSGKITNSVDGKLKIRGESFERDITLKPDGTFSETFDINYSGSYLIGSAKNRAAIYLTKGSALNVSADENDFYKSLKYTGKGGIENTYIANKNNYVNAINQEKLYTLDETAFLAELKMIKKDLLEIYKSTKFEDAAFKEKELKNLDYLEQVFIVSYPKNHAHFAKIADYKASATFPKIDSKINLDDEASYLFSNPYKQLVNSNFNESLESKVSPETEYFWKVALPEIKKLKSPSIKNALLQSLSYEVSAANPDSEALYIELLANSTNPAFKSELTEKYNKIKALVSGKLSPGFDYENHKGGKTSLASLKGKYVYIDVWATWCGPCIREIPSLQKVEEDYKGKNVEFVSISIDAKKDYEKWKKMVVDRQMGGVQLLADKDWSSQFAVDYAIVSIPRFILIGPDGNIVNADAPRPSDPALVKLFTDLKI